MKWDLTLDHLCICFSKTKVQGLDPQRDFDIAILSIVEPNFKGMSILQLGVCLSILVDRLVLALLELMY